MALALFDMDDTLLKGNCETEWFHFLSDAGHFEPGSHLAVFDEFDCQYAAGTLDILEYMQYVLRPLIELPHSQLQRWHDEFVETRITSLIPDKSRELLAKHREAGDVLVLITACNSFNASPIAELLGMDHLIATQLEVVNGRYTGNPVLPACIGDGKVMWLNEWLQSSGHSLQGSYFYSDSRNDIPLMEQSEFPVVVDPDPHLESVAKDRNWQRISLHG